MNLRFRPNKMSTEDRKEMLSGIPKVGDTVRIIGSEENYTIEGVGMKLYKLSKKDNPSIKKSAFKRDVIRIFI